MSQSKALARIALCELASHLLKKVLPEVSTRSEEAPVGGAHVSALVASLGEADRAQVVRRLGQPLFLVGKRFVDRGTARKGVIERPVQRRCHRLLASIVVYRHPIV